MKTKKVLSLILAAAMMLTIPSGLVGCKTNKKPTPSVTTTKKDADQHLKLILIEPATLDPNEAQDTSTSTILTETQEGLARTKVINGKDTIVPAGAKSWEISKDGLTWTFHLRDYKWSDGVPVTAQQYVDSFRRLLDQNNAFAYAYFAYEIKGAEDYNLGKGKAEDVGVVAKDDKTLVITLCRPTPYFEKKIAFVNFQPVRLDVIKKGGDSWKTDPSKQVYCGPYTIKSWVKNNSITLEKNPTYWDASNVYIKTVDMNDIQEFSTQAQLFETQQLDVTGSTQDYIKKWQEAAKQGKFQYGTGDVPTTEYLAFNNKGGLSGLMSNKKIRLALALSFDRKDYIDTLTNRYSPAYGWIPKTIQSGKTVYRDAVKEPLKELAAKYEKKPEKLKELFKEGLKELGKDTDLSKVKLKYVTYGSSTTVKETNEWWQQQFKKNLGIDVSVDVLGNYTLFSATRKSGKWDILMDGWSADFDDPINFLDFFASDNTNNSLKYSNPDYTKMVDDLDNEKDPAVRLKQYQKLEKLLIADDVAFAPIYYGDTRRFLQNYVKDFMYPRFGTIYEWRWAYTSGRK